MNVGRVDELQVEYLIARGKPSPNGDDLLGGENCRTRILHTERRQVGLLVVSVVMKMRMMRMMMMQMSEMVMMMMMIMMKVVRTVMV